MKPLTPQQLADIAEILDALDTRLRDTAALKGGPDTSGKRALLWREDRPEAVVPPTRPFSFNNATL